ncbi:MAG TPA: intradiol ring-cleavage dioxygenase, partial [Pseudoduganella sp.]
MAHHGHSLEEDLQTMLNTTTGRRQSLRWLLASAASLPILGCGGSSDTSASTSTGTTSTGTTTTGTTGTTPTGTTGTTTTTTSGSCSVIPEETGGPYPADGTNSNGSGVVNVLTQSGVVRSDIRSSFGSL